MKKESGQLTYRPTPCYAKSGTDTAYRAVTGTDPLYGAGGLRTRCAVRGTDVSSAAISQPLDCGGRKTSS
eukprot:3745046-Rhodomonas_salina.1